MSSASTDGSWVASDPQSSHDNLFEPPRRRPTSKISRVTASELREWKQDLARLLKRTEIIDAILKKPATALKGVDTRCLGRIAAHFNQTFSEEPEAKKRKITTSASTSKAKSQAPSEAAHNPASLGSWSPILRSSLQIDEAVDKLLKGMVPMLVQEPDKQTAYKLIGIEFFEVPELANHNFKHDYSHKIHAFNMQFTYMTALVTQQGLDRVRWLFQVVFWHDLYMLCRPDTTGSKPSESMTDAVIDTFMADVSEQTEHEVHLAKRAMSTQVKDWAMKGLKAKILVDKFGVESLFLLQDILTSNFLKDKITGRGRNFDAAMLYLESNGFREKLLEFPELKEIGEAIRAYLIRPFIENQILVDARDSHAS